MSKNSLDTSTGSRLNTPQPNAPNTKPSIPLSRAALSTNVVGISALFPPFANTALAAKWVADNDDRTVAAIGSRDAAELFGLEVIDHGINESRSNSTRFAIFSRVANKQVGKGGGVHSVLLFTVRNEAGALAQAIDVIGQHGFNMRTLRSRPMKELLWEYYFYIEVEGNVQSEKGSSLMESLGEFCDKLKFAGTYIKL